MLTHILLHTEGLGCDVHHVKPVYPDNGAPFMPVNLFACSLAVQALLHGLSTNLFSPYRKGRLLRDGMVLQQYK